MATTQKFLDNGTGLPKLWDIIKANFARFAFKTVKVGTTDVIADSKDDTITFIAGTNVTLTPNATNDSVTFAATDTKYVTSSTTVGSAHVSDTVDVDDITTWNAGSRPSVEILNGILTFNPGSTPSLGYTGRQVPIITVSSSSVLSGVQSTTGEAADQSSISALTSATIDSVCS